MNSPALRAADKRTYPKRGARQSRPRTSTGGRRSIGTSSYSTALNGGGPAPTSQKWTKVWRNPVSPLDEPYFGSSPKASFQIPMWVRVDELTPEERVLYEEHEEQKEEEREKWRKEMERALLEEKEREEQEKLEQQQQQQQHHQHLNEEEKNDVVAPENHMDIDTPPDNVEGKDEIVSTGEAQLDVGGTHEEAATDDKRMNVDTKSFNNHEVNDKKTMDDEEKSIVGEEPGKANIGDQQMGNEIDQQTLQVESKAQDASGKETIESAENLVNTMGNQGEINVELENKNNVDADPKVEHQDQDQQKNDQETAVETTKQNSLLGTSEEDQAPISPPIGEDLHNSDNANTASPEDRTESNQFQKRSLEQMTENQSPSTQPNDTEDDALQPLRQPPHKKLRWRFHMEEEEKQEQNVLESPQFQQKEDQDMQCEEFSSDPNIEPASSQSTSPDQDQATINIPLTNSATVSADVYVVPLPNNQSGGTSNESDNVPSNEAGVVSTAPASEAPSDPLPIDPPGDNAGPSDP